MLFYYHFQKTWNHVFHIPWNIFSFYEVVLLRLTFFFFFLILLNPLWPTSQKFAPAHIHKYNKSNNIHFPLSSRCVFMLCYGCFFVALTVFLIHFITQLKQTIFNDPHDHYLNLLCCPCDCHCASTHVLSCLLEVNPGNFSWSCHWN